MSVTRYDKKNCFELNSTACSNEEKGVAILDYIGATRGEAGKVNFDGKLTDEEKQYIESKFGQLSDLSSEYLDVYFENADQIFLKDHINALKSANSPVASQYDSPACQKKDRWKAVQQRDTTAPQATILGGAHRCLTQYMKLYRENVSEFKVLQNPEDYHFFIESIEYGIDPNNIDISKLALAAEVQLFARIAKSLNIPVSEGTPFDTFHAETIEKASKDFNRNTTDYYLIYLLDNFFSFRAAYQQELVSKGKSFTSEGWNAFWEKCIDATQKKFGLNSSEEKELIEALYRFFKTTVPEKPSKTNIAFTYDDIRNGSDQSRFYSQLTQELSQTANALSIPQLKEQLTQSGKKHAMFVVGFHHIPMAEGVFQAIHQTKLPDAEDQETPSQGIVNSLTYYMMTGVSTPSRFLYAILLTAQKNAKK